MARISLRDYNREIEELVDSGRTDEAIAHCRYILENYPKHVSTYRSLGKALLESQRYGDAADVFKRVLACIPDDFIAHLGMSIIREDEGDLDGSIWHMERAFEVQPSNAAVQSELRRLYGRRDGLSPAKVQLTRGAMARMSAKSHLYSQAIAELRTALADDPQRPDLQVLLARMYVQTGQRLAAVEACSALLGKFPYCLEANRLMVEILPGTERAAEAEAFRQRLEELDPYESHISPAAASAEQVPAGAITLERLDYLDVQGPFIEDAGQPQWASSLGVSIDKTPSGEEPLPEWLSEPDKSVASADLAGSVETPSPAEIPDWMREAGWETATGEGGEDLPGYNAFEEELAGSEELASAEIPDWLQGMAPVEQASQEMPESGEVADRTGELVGAAFVAASLQDTPYDQDELAIESISGETIVTSPAEEMESQPAEAIIEENPVALEGGVKSTGIGVAGAAMLGAVLIAEGDHETRGSEMEETDQLKPSGESVDEGLSGEQPASPEENQEQAESTSLPDWLTTPADGSQPIVQESELPDWLAPAAMSAATLADEQPSETEDELPDWLAPLEKPSSGTEIAGMAVATSAVMGSADKDETPIGAEPSQEAPVVSSTEEASPGVAEWLAASASETPDASSMRESDEEKPTEDIPDWLANLSPEAEESAEGGGEVKSEDTGGQEPGLAQAEIPQWLREMEGEPTGEPIEVAQVTLSEESTAESEEFNLETGEIPDWLKTAMAAEVIDQAIVRESEQLEPISQPVIEGDTQPVRIRTVEMETTIEEADQKPLEVAETVVDEGVEAEISEEVAERIEPEETSMATLVGLTGAEALTDEGASAGFENEDEAMAWLESLAARQGALEEELLTSPEERPVETPEWIQQFAGESTGQAEMEEEETQPEGAPALAGLAGAAVAGLVAKKISDGDEDIEEPEAVSPPAAVEMVEAPMAEVVEAVEIEPPGEADISGEMEPLGEAGLPHVAGAAGVAAWLAEELPTEPEPPESKAPEAEEVELPDWLSDLEAETSAPTPEMVTGEWTPPVEITGPEIIQEQVAESPRLDINAASLAQLERVPGVGFIIAQSIVAYREVNGPFTSLDQLQEIPGISSETMDDLRNRLVVEMVAEAAPPPPSVPELAQAWQSIANGNIPSAVDQYTIFIRAKQDLDEVIAEIQEALLIYPLDPLLYQTLGDAYLRADRLQEALEAYNRAEDLLK